MIQQLNSASLNSFVDDQAGPEAKVYTDGSRAYKCRENHEAVRHSVGEYVRGEIHTNSIGSFLVDAQGRAHKDLPPALLRSTSSGTWTSLRADTTSGTRTPSTR